MKKKPVIIFSTLILATFSASGQLNIGSVSHDMNPLKPGTTHEITVPIENTGPVPQSSKFTLKAESTVNTSYEKSIFNVSGDLGGSSFNSCSFSYSNAYVYTCPGDGRMNISNDFDDTLTFEVTAPLGMRGGSNLLSFNVSADTQTGKINKETSISGEETGKELGNFEFDVTGADASGEIATVKSYTFGEASSNEVIGRFSTGITGHDSIEFSHKFSESFIKHYDYSFGLYNYSSGSWEEIDVNVDTEDYSVSSEISGNGYYALYIDREKLSIQDLVGRETNITKNVSRSEANVDLQKLGETENLSISVPTLEEKNGVKLNGFEVMSKVNDTASFKASMLESLPGGTEEVSSEDFNSTSFADVTSEPNGSLKFKSYSFQMSPDLFNFSENVVGYRFDGNEWHEMETSLQSQGANYYTFDSKTDGNSVLAFGKFKSDIEMGSVQHEDELLDNETLNIDVPLENDWRGRGEFTVNYSLNGSEGEEETVEIEGEGNKTVEFKENNLEPGNYTVIVNGQESRFEVKLRSLKYRILDRSPFNSLKIMYIAVLVVISLPILIISYLKRDKIKPHVEPITHRMPAIKPKIPFLGGKDQGSELDGEIDDIDEEKDIELGENKEAEEKESKSDQAKKDKEETDRNDLEPDEDDLRCDKCDRIFNSLEGLKKHISNVHERSEEEKDGDYLCAICGEIFDTATGLELHHKKFHED